MERLTIKGRTIGRGTPLVCVPIMRHTMEEIAAEASRLVEKEEADMLEWRLDAFEGLDDREAIREVLRSLAPITESTILVCTFRSREQGGLVQLPYESVRKLRRIAAESGTADVIDVEFFAEGDAAREILQLRELGVRVIASHHDFEKTPSQDEMRRLLEQMKDSGADIVKLAVMPRQEKDVLKLLSETLYFRKVYRDRPIITMSMGEIGSISRVCGEFFGSCVTFGAGTDSSAPGQLPAEELRQVLDILHRCYTRDT